MKRREVLGAPLAAGLLPLAGTVSAKEASTGTFGAKPMPHGVDRERASFILREMGLDALLLTEPESVRWATGAVPATTRLGIPGGTFALIPQDLAAPVVLICHQFSWYYSVSDTGMAPDVEAYLVAPMSNDEGAFVPFILGDLEEGQVAPREAARRASTEASRPFYGSFDDALRAAMPGSTARKIVVGFDETPARQLIETALPHSTAREARQAALHMRLIKTEREIEAISRAAQANLLAAHAAVAELPNLTSSDDLRRSYYGHAARLGNIPGFMVINGSISEDWVEALREGTAILIDCVSHQDGYNGDYGRTVFFGEPSRAIAGKARAVVAAWQALRAELRPGLRFSEVRARGASIMAKIAPGLPVPFSPHSVGLAHTEHPTLDFAGNPLDPVLEPGMVISVDCPLLQTGEDGTVHLEDLMLITQEGARALHDTDDPILIV